MKARNVALVAAVGRRRRRPRLVAPALAAPRRAAGAARAAATAPCARWTVTDPSTTELEALAAGVRDSLTGGA